MAKLAIFPNPQKKLLKNSLNPLLITL
jgi:hypothetical protein